MRYFVLTLWNGSALRSYTQQLCTVICIMYYIYFCTTWKTDVRNTFGKTCVSLKNDFSSSSISSAYGSSSCINNNSQLNCLWGIRWDLQVREASALSGLFFHCWLLNWSSYHREANWRGITSTSPNDMLATDTEGSLLQR